MLHLNPNSTTNRIVVTLTELVTVTDPIFLFEFENITTKGKHFFEFASSADMSTSKQRYNEFQLDATDLIEGQYLYRVTEKQTSKLLENGRALVSDGVAFTYDEYSTPTTYTAYGG